MLRCAGSWQLSFSTCWLFLALLKAMSAAVVVVSFPPNRPRFCMARGAVLAKLCLLCGAARVCQHTT